MPREGEGTLHLDHLSIWIYTGNSLELSQLRDTSLYQSARRLGLSNRTSASHQLKRRWSRGERGADSATR